MKQKSRGGIEIPPLLFAIFMSSLVEITREMSVNNVNRQSFEVG